MRPYTTLLIALAAAGAAAAAEHTHRVSPVVQDFVNAKGDVVAGVWKDPDTGCEYLLFGTDTLPRLGRDGRPRCE